MIPASMFPPTPERLIAGVQILVDAGLALGKNITDFMLTVFKFVA